MRRSWNLLRSIPGLLCLLPFAAADWPQFRGPELGVASDANPPVEWDVAEGRNVAWQADLPGRGPGSPIVVGDRVFVTASDGVKQDRLHVLCFAVGTGKPLWHRQFWATGRTACHPSSANAAPTPASDGQRVFAFFSSNDLICLDLEGNLQWYRGLAFDFPQAGNDVGMSSSPAVVDGVVIVQVENQSDSFAAGIDAQTGETRWRVEREPAAAWCSPVAVRASGNQPSMVLLQSSNILTAHDPGSGKILWQVATPCDVIPSPTLVARRAYFVAANGLTAVDVDPAAGTAQAKWDSNRLKPGAASPVVAGNRVYIVNRAGVLNCADEATGELRWQLRLQGSFWSSPVLVGDRMYLFSDDGQGQVVRVGDQEGQLLAKNPMGEGIQATPAVAGDSLYIRSDKHLWRITATR